jgi:hypothetical protein
LATVTIKECDLSKGTDQQVYVIWEWTTKNTKEFKVKWEYLTKDGYWSSDVTEETVSINNPKNSQYTAPSEAKAVRVKIKPVAKTYKVKQNKKTIEKVYWEADWSAYKDATYYFKNNPPSIPPTPTISIEKITLTIRVDNLQGTGTKKIRFQIVRNDETAVINYGYADVIYGTATYVHPCTAGCEYRVRCKAINDNGESDWSDWSNNDKTTPKKPQGVTVSGLSATSVFVQWADCTGAESYEIQYVAASDYTNVINDLFSSDQVQSVTGILDTWYTINGLESGNAYYFRVRAINSAGESSWMPDDVAQTCTILGKPPSAPTTWSSTTTVIVGEDLILYWVHNSEDNSSQIEALLEITIDGVTTTQSIRNTTDPDERDKTSFYKINTSAYKAGAVLKWRVKTSGITGEFGEWSVLRTVNIYAQPTLELIVADYTGSAFEYLTSFPINITGNAGPDTQKPIGYHLSIVSKERYETVDYLGNDKIVNENEEVYSKYFSIDTDLSIQLLPSDIDLENNVSYIVKCMVTMNSGLDAESSIEFKVSWTDEFYEPNAEIGYDNETFSTFIRPYCEQYPIEYYTVQKKKKSYIKSDEQIDATEGEIIYNAVTTTGESVYSAKDSNGNTFYYCMTESENGTRIEGLKLSVYRREYDGSFVELMSGIDNMSNAFITDPHPALDYARYRIVAITEATGAVSYYDIPSFPIGGVAAIIQWDEQWTTFHVSENDVVEEIPWSGSLLQLPYNIDVSDSNGLDVALVEYIGREHPVSYYGTQLGIKSTWNMDIPKDDTETLYALRRLSRWTGDCYVREPSGSGYWAQVGVAFSQKHLDVVIPVTLTLTRVEGGI